MYARKEDERSAVFRKALEVGEDYQWRVKVRGSLETACQPWMGQGEGGVTCEATCLSLTIPYWWTCLTVLPAVGATSAVLSFCMYLVFNMSVLRHLGWTHL